MASARAGRQGARTHRQSAVRARARARHARPELVGAGQLRRGARPPRRRWAPSKRSSLLMEHPDPYVRRPGRRRRRGLRPQAPGGRRAPRATRSAVLTSDEHGLHDSHHRGRLVYFLAINAVYTVLLALSFLETEAAQPAHRLRAATTSSCKSPLTLPISVLMPAYNEAETIVEAVNAMRLLEYGEFEIVVIDDGSKDATLDRAHRARSRLSRSNARSAARSRVPNCVASTHLRRWPTSRS